jgi:large subunit ribosomal protein L23
MDLTIYDIIKGPRITQKAIRLNQVYKQLVVDVHPQANKPMIVDALKKLFGVEVERLRVSISKGKRRRSGRHITVGVRKKKAIVTLKEGYSMDLTKMSTDTAVKAE